VLSRLCVGACMYRDQDSKLEFKNVNVNMLFTHMKCIHTLIYIHVYINTSKDQVSKLESKGVNVNELRT
jgi:hypothetical protein